MKEREQDRSFSPQLKSILIVFVSIAGILLVYGMYSILSDILYPSGKLSRLDNSETMIDFTYDTKKIPEQDARIAYAVLQKLGYYSTPGRTARAHFTVDAHNVYTIVLIVPKSTLNDRSTEYRLREALKELKSTFPARTYQFQICAVDKKGAVMSKTIKL